MRMLVGVLLAVMACGGKRGAQPDASEVDAPPPPPVPIYLNFEGGALHHGSATNSANDTWALIPADVTLAPYLAGNPDRQTTIDTILADARSILEPFNVALVTTRPVGTSFLMIVFSSKAEDYGLQMDTTGLEEGNCHAEQGMIAGEFESTFPFDNPAYRASLIVTFLGLTAGLPYTLDHGDCMCQIDQGCDADFGAPCTIGGPGTQVDTTSTPCAQSSTIDEQTLFFGHYGVAP